VREHYPPRKQSPIAIRQSLFLYFRLAHLPTCRFADKFWLGITLPSRSVRFRPSTSSRRWTKALDFAKILIAAQSCDACQPLKKLLLG
jgi:hypothetical protein